ncbi:MAG: hypothetical protein K2V38_04300, partial [Gemmataceae bacterium]|nr:hypothetical protein [Gemmataceae bacterium]
KRIGFAGASYAAGEVVEAWAELTLADKHVLNAEVAAVAVEADGAPLPVDAGPRTDAAGRTRIKFQLPDDVRDGDVRLKVTFRTPRGDETVADRVPVVGRRLHVEFFPEGGTFVAGVPNRVYVRATTPAGQPVDVRGSVFDGRQSTPLAAFQTPRDPDRPGANRGLAAFTITPRANTPMWLKLDAPAGVWAPILPASASPVRRADVAGLGGVGAIAARTGFLLPRADLDGVALSVLEEDAITAPGQPIRVHLRTVGKPRALVVGAFIRGRLADTQRVVVEPNATAEVRLLAGGDPVSAGRGGVVRITAFEELPGAQNLADNKGEKSEKGEPAPDLVPLAERLVFRRPGELLDLSLSVRPAVAAQLPGGETAGKGSTEVVCNVLARDERKNPVAAVLWAAAVNTGVACGPKDRALPTHFLLAGEVKNPDDLEYADFLLTTDPNDLHKAREALDLVLGTQGWRRFVEQARFA